ncbi:hypothetical protein L1787_06230 [Acuticoccus sp. M5D2P5]|uniref:truncated hemoglobin n=1 Tax=Acuticoccus kalidii TaxID=2910977 RepID=UPI001F15F6CF|nr:hypothetical protein [Acuticoccus kalidii]MCF3933011.1 hypothetical protein [Acuticoccus kalidii]
MILRNGEPETLSRLIFCFYDFVLSSPRLSPYFAETNMRRLVERQVKYIASLLDGAPLDDEDEFAAPRAVAIPEIHFDELIAHLKAALDHVDLDEASAAIVLAEFETRRWAIIASPLRGLSRNAGDCAAPDG